MEKKILNLNGKSLMNSNDIWDDSVGKKVWSLISVQGDGYLTVKGGDVLAKENDCYAADVRGGAHLIIEDGFWRGNISAIYVLEGTLEVKGGEFDVIQLDPTNKDKRFMLNCYDANYKAGKAKIIVSGGKFHGFDPGNNLAEGPETNFLAKGFASIEREPGVFEVVPEDQA
jgi:hypothetical protein